jgi:hypothetical protein
MTYTKNEAPQAMRSSVRNLRAVFAELERKGHDMDWRTLYNVLDSIIGDLDAELARQGKAGQR